MTQLLALFGTALVVGFSGAIMPGPLLTVAVSESARRGFLAGPRLVLGHALAEVALVAALAAGLSTLIRHSAVTGTIGLIGGVFLLWMAFGMVRGAWQDRVRIDAAVGARPGGRRLVMSGALVSLANPYWLLWWATIGADFVRRGLVYALVGVAVFYVGHILSDLIWYSFVSFAISSGRSLLRERVFALAYRIVIAVCGLFLLGLGIYFFLSGVQFFRG